MAEQELVREGVVNPLVAPKRDASADFPLVAASPAGATPGGMLMAAWRNRWIVLLCVLATSAAGVIYVQTATPLYTSTAKLYLDYAGPRVPDFYVSGTTPQTDRYLNTQAGLIKSRPNLSATVDALAARPLRTFAHIDNPVAYLRKKLLVEVGSKDDIISISLRSASAVEAAEIVNRVVDTYFASRSEHGQENSTQVLKILQEEMAQTNKDLEAKRNELTAFQASRKPESVALEQGEAGLVQNACVQAKLKMLDSGAFLNAARALAQDPLALRQYVLGKEGVGMDQERTSLEARLASLEVDRDAALKAASPDHSRISDMPSEMERTKAKLTKLDDRFINAVINAAEQEYAEAKSNLDAITSYRDEHQRQVRDWSAEATQFHWLKSDVDALTAHRQTLDEKIRQLQTMVDGDASQLKMAVLEPATAPEKPSSPRKGLLLQTALMLGLLLGGAVVSAREWRSHSLHSVDEVSGLLHLPILGTVPAMSRWQKARDRGRKVRLQPNSLEAEAFRTIRTALFFGIRQSNMRTLLVTSPAPGDGKSMLVSNLAIAMADAGQKTLILDADFRTPVQHAIFGLDHKEQCLARVLAGKMKLSAAIQPTGVDGLHLLSCGLDVPYPAEVLNSRRFALILARLAGAYDRILIDAPPVGAVTDAQIIGALSDATVLVLRAGKCTCRIAQRATGALRSVSAHPVGVVVNGVRRADHYCGYYYEKYYKLKDAGSDDGDVGKLQEMVLRPDDTAAPYVLEGSPGGNKEQEAPQERLG